MTNEEREDLNTFRHDLIKRARWWQWKAETLEKENEQLKAENAALRSATQYLIDDGGADCCAKCIYCPQPTEEDDDCLCHHGGDCVDGVTKWFMQNG